MQDDLPHPPDVPQDAPERPPVSPAHAHVIPAPAAKPGRVRTLLAAARAHPFRSFLILAAVLVLAELATIPWFSVGGLRTAVPRETALMRQRRDEADEQGKKLTIVQRWVPLSRLPRHLLNAVIVAEDGTFYSHGGFDWFEVRKSLERNIEQRRAARGASTITQQLAKNLFLSTSRDPIRKVKEAILTLLLEFHLTKSRILELYVNLIEWGPGVFGVEAAARSYFGKPASALTLDESLRLAAVIPSPLRHRPTEDSRTVLRRAEIVRRRMQARGWLPGPVVPEDQRELEELEKIEEMEEMEELKAVEGVFDTAGTQKEGTSDDRQMVPASPDTASAVEDSTAAGIDSTGGEQQP